MNPPEPRNLPCVGADGELREFLWRVTEDPLNEKWIFRVETQDKWLSGECFELVMGLLPDADGVRVVMMNHYEQDDYRAKGIPDALLPKIKRHLELNVESSPESGDTTDVRRTPAATSVWKRLVASKLADYDPDRDVYFLL
ncbi:MAG: hypothetical protein JWM63_987 [Gammaproteobacteria bacterium]|nr:hypothetical protein [Gammaproteobacteria bacterium]